MEYQFAYAMLRKTKIRSLFYLFIADQFKIYVVSKELLIMKIYAFRVLYFRFPWPQVSPKVSTPSFFNFYLD